MKKEVLEKFEYKNLISKFSSKNKKNEFYKIENYKILFNWYLNLLKIPYLSTLI